MKTRYVVILAMLAGAALGAAAVNGLNAQGKAPGAYAVFTYTEIPDPAGFKTNVADTAVDIAKKHGGNFIVRTAVFSVLREGTPPFPLKRYAIIAFDSVQQAKDWYNSADVKDGRTYLEEHTKGRAFVVPAAAP